MAETVEQPTAAPTRKVTAAGLGGALTVIIVFVINSLGTEVPGEVASAITTVVTFLAGYFIKERAT